MLFYPAMKQTLLCLALALLAAPAWAADPSELTPVTLQFFRAQNGVGGEIINFYTPFVYADGTTLLPGEEVAALFVVHPAGTQIDPSAPVEPPFTFTAEGLAHPTADAERIVWAAIPAIDREEHGALIGEGEYAGLPITEVGWVGFLPSTITLSCYWPMDGGEFPEDRPVSLWLVTFDTRANDPATGKTAVAPSAATGDHGPAGIRAWGAVCCYVGSLTGAGTGPVVALNVPEEGKEIVGSVTKRFATLAGPTRPADFSTLVVAGETLTDPAAIEAALKPAISGLTVADDALSLTLTPPAAGPAATYTLYTATDLDGDWKPLDTLLQEKGLANPGTFRYTMWRISKENQVELPRFPGESARFYRLRCDTANDVSPAEKR